MLLYHTTKREHCPSIAREGFIESPSGKYGPGVYFAAGVWWADGSHDLSLADAILPADRIVLAFNLPDEISAEHFTGGTIYCLNPDDPDYDPEIDTPDETTGCEYGEEWCVPASVANTYFAGVAFHHGEMPFTDKELGQLNSRAIVRATASV